MAMDRFPNLFLLDNRHDPTCFCVLCRQRRADGIIGQDRTEESLRQTVQINLPRDRKARSYAVLEVTKEQIVFGKLYKEVCLAGTRFTYFKSWAKRQPAYQIYLAGNEELKLEFDNHCQDVNDAAFCFDHWDKVVANLTDRRMYAIDARSFSVHYFSKAASIDWCLEYNEKVCRKKPSHGGEQLYSQVQIDNIFQDIINTGILDTIEHDERIAASIGSQLQRRMVSYCRLRRARNHPYGH